MTAAKLVAPLAVSFLLLWRTCGFEPDERRGEGEPCTRTTECDALLECRGGVCMPEGLDAGPGDADGGAPADASHDAAAPVDAAPVDAAFDAAALDAAALDAAAPDPVDGGSTDASPSLDGG